MTQYQNGDIVRRDAYFIVTVYHGKHLYRGRIILCEWLYHDYDEYMQNIVMIFGIQMLPSINL